jgi:hypothetical protein
MCHAVVSSVLRTECGCPARAGETHPITLARTAPHAKSAGSAQDAAWRWPFSSHHDAPGNGLWRAIEPILEALKGKNPDVITVSQEYRMPVCFNSEVNIQRGR